MYLHLLLNVLLLQLTIESEWQHKVSSPLICISYMYDLDIIFVQHSKRVRVECDNEI